MKYRYAALYNRTSVRSQLPIRAVYYLHSTKPGPGFSVATPVEPRLSEALVSLQVLGRRQAYRLTLTTILEDFKHIGIYHHVDSDTSPIHRTRALNSGKGPHIHQWHRNSFPRAHPQANAVRVRAQIHKSIHKSAASHQSSRIDQPSLSLSRSLYLHTVHLF